MKKYDFCEIVFICDIFDLYIIYEISKVILNFFKNGFNYMKYISNECIKIYL